MTAPKVTLSLVVSSFTFREMAVKYAFISPRELGFDRPPETRDLLGFDFKGWSKDHLQDQELGFCETDDWVYILNADNGQLPQHLLRLLINMKRPAGDVCGHMSVLIYEPTGELNYRYRLAHTGPGDVWHLNRRFILRLIDTSPSP
jgi:hypothetical protein